MNPTTRIRSTALLKISGFEDGPALTVQSSDGEIPQGRELSFAWLTGTVLTGVTSVMLMGVALIVSFKGQDTFSTAYEALQLITRGNDVVAMSQVKGDRMRPIAKTKSELEIVEASIRETVDGKAMIRKQPFVRVRATLATAATSLSANVPDYDPVKLIDTTQPSTADSLDSNPEIYGANVEGDVEIKSTPMPVTLVPPTFISDAAAASFVRTAVENTYSEGDPNDPALAYAAPVDGVRDLGVVDGDTLGIAENVTIMPKTSDATETALGRTERIITFRSGDSFKDVLLKNGFADGPFQSVAASLRAAINTADLPSGSKLRILMGSARGGGETLVPQRLSIYVPDSAASGFKHMVTTALADQGAYVLSLAPADIVFPADDTEQINVNNLPTLYRSIWETARKHDISDATTSRIVALFAYDVDLTKKISPGDSIEILETEKDADGNQDLLYVGLKLGSTTHELFRFRSDDGSVDYFDPSGETGKRFLTRRPVQGGGRLASRFGMRVHPIFHTRRMHSGVDFAARTGTPIYAAGDGVVEKAQWVSGYGRFVMLRHVNGFETGYGHMSKFAEGMKPGTRVRQGQIIGYVGSTGNSTGPHLHFEIKVNGRFVDPLSVKLPRDKSLSAQYDGEFKQAIAQIRDLMTREASPLTVADAQLGTPPATQ